MSFSANLQYLRRISGAMTQERLAEKLCVSRQTVSNWESDQGYPEMSKLLALCDEFHCTLDALIREDLPARKDIFSEVSVLRVKPFRMARYVIISPNPEDDVIAYMNVWAKKSGLAAWPNPVLIGWDFPYISPEQSNRFHLRGYVAAYVLPDGFSSDVPGVEITEQPAANYAKIRISEPFLAPFERIPEGYRRIMAYLGANGFQQKQSDPCIPCFEREFKDGGTGYMDVYVRADNGQQPVKTVQLA